MSVLYKSKLIVNLLKCLLELSFGVEGYFWKKAIFCRSSTLVLGPTIQHKKPIISHGEDSTYSNC